MSVFQLLKILDIFLYIRFIIISLPIAIIWFILLILFSWQFIITKILKMYYNPNQQSLSYFNLLSANNANFKYRYSF